MTASWGSLFDRAESHDVDREAIRAALERRRDVPGDDGSAMTGDGDG